LMTEKPSPSPSRVSRLVSCIGKPALNRYRQLNRRAAPRPAAC
jgi:hypothetical protein